MTNLEIQARYPRLVGCLMWVGCLSTGEAIGCIRDYKAGFMTSGEAVNHFGGTHAVLRAAARDRVRHLVLSFPPYQPTGSLTRP